MNNARSKLYRGYSGFPLRLWWCTAAVSASTRSDVVSSASLPSRGLASVTLRLVLRILCHFAEGSHPLGISDRYAAIFWIRRPLQHHCVLADRGCFAFHGRGTVRAARVSQSGSGFVGQCVSSQFFHFVSRE
jgi:hypothetical protein